MIQAVIFDVDGVLLDTVPYHFRAWKQLFSEEGVSFTFQDYVQLVNGLPRDIGIKNILGDRTKEDLAALAARKQGYFLSFVAQNPPQPLEGVKELLEELHKRKLLLAAASSSKNAPLLVEKAGLAKLLQANVGGSDFTFPKPHPDIFLTAAKKLGASPETCVVVEDAYLGIQAAKEAGMKTIGVLSSQDAEIPKLADVTIATMTDKKSILAFLDRFL